MHACVHMWMHAHAFVHTHTRARELWYVSSELLLTEMYPSVDDLSGLSWKNLSRYYLKFIGFFSSLIWFGIMLNLVWNDIRLGSVGGGEVIMLHCGCVCESGLCVGSIWHRVPALDELWTWC